MTSHLLIMLLLFLFSLSLSYFFSHFSLLCFYSSYSDKCRLSPSNFSSVWVFALEGSCIWLIWRVIGPSLLQDFQTSLQSPWSHQWNVRSLLHGGHNKLPVGLFGNRGVILFLEDIILILSNDFALYFVIYVWFNNKIMFSMSYY